MEAYIDGRLILKFDSTKMGFEDVNWTEVAVWRAFLMIVMTIPARNLLII